MDYSRIKVELEQKSISIRELCYRIDVTEQGLHQMIRNKSMKIEILERISYVLELPVSYWFEDMTSIGDFTSNQSVSTDINSKLGKLIPSKLVHEKIDSLTNGLNEILKVVISR